MEHGQSFWIVVSEVSAKYGSYFKHRDKQLAREEAKRLAKLNPGVEFTVFESIYSIGINLVIETQYDDIPF